MERSTLPHWANHVCLLSSLRPALYKQQQCKDDRWEPFPREASRSNKTGAFQKVEADTKAEDNGDLLTQADPGRLL